MNLDCATYVVRIDYEELKEIAFCLYRKLRDSIDSHYNRLQQDKDGESLFYEMEAKRLQLLKETSCLIGFELHTAIVAEATSLFKNKREERAKTNSA